MANQDKRAALIDEGMTEAEADYMLSGGAKSEGLTPPAESAAPPEPEKPAQATEPEKSAEPPAPVQAAPPEPVEEDDPEPAKDSPFYPQWKREKTRRQELQRELKAREDSIAAERASTAAGREKWARLDERLRVFQQASMKSPARCAWCGRTYEEHETFRAPNAPVPRVPCLLLRNGYVPSAAADQLQDDTQANHDAAKDSREWSKT